MQAKVREAGFSYGDEGFRLFVPKFDLSSGERVALIGPSGSGKTTFLHLLAGILVPREGLVQVGEKELSRLDDFTRRTFRISKLGLVFQDFRLIEHLNARENMLLPYRLGAELRLKESVLDRMRILAERLRVSGLLDSPVKRLSQGERQRVAIGRALLVRPGMILADEPTGNLDPSGKQRIMDLLFDQALELEATLIVVTHDHALLDRFDRVVDFDRIGEREVDRV